MKIGVITLPFNPNYGWLLQAYAMQQLLRELGHEPILISRRWNIVKQNSSFITKCLRPIYYNICCGKLYSFFNKNIKQTRIYRSDDEIKNVIEEYRLDAVIVGSDQVWRIENTRGVGYNFFLDFASDGKTKCLSYAASFGNDSWKGTAEDNAIITNLLTSFSGVSVREESGIEICQTQFNANAICVLDPTLLLDNTKYDALLSKPNRCSNTRYLATYILDPSKEKESYIQSIAEEKNLKIDSLFIKSRKNNFHIYKSLENWLLKIRNAEYVVVDSFHGMVFCIIYHKQFIVIANKHRGNTRFENVLKKTGLEERLIYSLDENAWKLLYKTIDYDAVENKLQAEREFSINFLKHSLL